MRLAAAAAAAAAILLLLAAPLATHASPCDAAVVSASWSTETTNLLPSAPSQRAGPGIFCRSGGDGGDPATAQYCPMTCSGAECWCDGTPEVREVCRWWGTQPDASGSFVHPPLKGREPRPLKLGVARCVITNCTDAFGTGPDAGKYVIECDKGQNGSG